MKTISKEDLLEKSKRTHGLNMKELREFVEDNPDISDDAPVMCERVTDFYFNKSEFRGQLIEGWEVYLTRGMSIYNIEYHNKNMRQEILDRAAGKEPQYPGIENPEIMEITDEDMDQYHHSHCITADKEKEIVFIHNHY